MQPRPAWLIVVALALAVLGLPQTSAGQATPEPGETPAANASATPAPTPTPLVVEPTAISPTSPTQTAAPTLPTAVPSPASPVEPQSPASSSLDDGELPITSTPSAVAWPTEEHAEDASAPVPSTAPSPTGTGTPAPTETPTIAPTETPRSLTLRIESADLRFGKIDASGQLSDSASSGLVTAVDPTGATFVLPQAITLVVTGDAPWEIACSATGYDPASADLIATGRLQWRPAGSERWAPFAPDGEICLANADGGSRIHVLDVQLRVESSDPPGAFAATLTFTVEGQ